MFLDKDRMMDNVQKHNICGKYIVREGFNGKIFVTIFVKIDHLVRTL
jgi:hypothetical protein